SIWITGLASMLTNGLESQPGRAYIQISDDDLSKNPC
ncbi:MAG: hypothetical protein RLZZ444_3011, partial [Pseudomonadota bacterium]